MKAGDRLLAWLAYAAACLGWPGLLGLVLLLAAPGLTRFVTLPLQEEVHVTEARLQELARLPQVPAAGAAEDVGPLPAGEAAPEAVARLFSAAGHAGLRLEEGTYRSSARRSGELRRYQIVLPLSGSYPAIRAFLAEVMERRPELALDSLSFSRETIEGAEVRARLGLTLYLREAP